MSHNAVASTFLSSQSLSKKVKKILLWLEFSGCNNKYNYTFFNKFHSALLGL